MPSPAKGIDFLNRGAEGAHSPSDFTDAITGRRIAGITGGVDGKTGRVGNRPPNADRTDQQQHHHKKTSKAPP